MAQPRFGELLWQAVIQVKASKGRSITSIKRELAERCYVSAGAVEKWKKRSIPATETVEILARFGVSEAGMERVWLRAFLRAGEYYDGGALEQELFGKDRSALPTSRDNLPPLRSGFIGRMEEIGRLREGLALPYPLVSIEGIGGVGKTTLALKVAKMCLTGEINSAPLTSQIELDDVAPFEAIVWISAKDKADGELSLGEVLDAIAGVLDYTIVRQLSPDEKRAAVDRLLRAHRTLLIVDNFETVTDLNLVDFLKRVPRASKALITTRERRLRSVWCVPLYGLSETEARQKIRDQSQSLNLRAVASADLAILQPLIAITEGNPKALEMALGYIKYQNMALDEVIRSLAEANENVSELFDDLFARAWGLLPPESQRLLMVMPFFADSASRDALEAAADVHGWYLRAGIAQLIEMSLLETNEELVEARKRYSAHPLVIAFAGAKLREEPEFEVEARERWCEYFLQFATEHLVDKSQERYWNSLRKRHNTLSINPERTNLLKVLAWADEAKSRHLLIEMMMALVHYMDAQFLFKERISYARKAADAASKLDQKVDEAILRIDGLGWTLTEMARFTEAEQEINAGLQIAQSIGSDLVALAYAWLARTQINQNNLSLASSTISKAKLIENCEAMTRSRIYLAAGDIAHQEQNYLEAIRLYKESARLTHQYLDKRHAMELNYRLGFAYLGAGSLARAEESFKSLSEWEQTTEGFQAKFGLAQIAQAKGQPDKARQLAQEVFDDLSRLVRTHRLLKQVTDFLQELDES